MLLAQTSSRSLRRTLPPSATTSRALSSSFICSFPRNRPHYVGPEATRRTLGSLTGFRTRPPHQDPACSPPSPSDESAEGRRTWNRLLPSTWASKYVRTPTSRPVSEALASDPPPPAPPPSASDPTSPPPPALTPPADDPPTPPPPSEATPTPTASSTPPPPSPEPTPELPSEEHLRILQSTIADSLHVGRSLQGKASTFSSRRTTVEPPEPVVGVYCPLEGGTYVIDAGMDEIASRLGADLVYLDAVELGAEGTGALGPATSAIPLSPNPLKISGFNPSSGLSASKSTDAGVGPPAAWEDDEFDEDDDLDDDLEGLEDEDDDVDLSRPASSADHTFSSSSATRGNDWKAGAMSVVTNESTGPTAPPASEVEEVNDQPPASPFPSSPFFPAPDELKKERNKPSPPSSQEVLQRLFSEIVNAERSPTAVDLASPSLDETALLPTATPTLPNLADASKSAQSAPSSSSSTAPKPRIIYIKNAILMSSTFSTTSSPSRPSWFSELVSAVQARRHTHGPTTIVLGLSPSVLQTAYIAMPPMPRANFMSLLGIGPPASSGHQFDTVLWAASAEHRATEQKELALASRMAEMRDWKWGTLLPPFEGAQGQSSGGGPGGSDRSLASILGGRAPPPMMMGAPGGGGPGGVSMAFQVLPALLGSQGKPSSSDGSAASKTIWKIVGLVPRKREPEREKATRIETRLRINELVFKIGAKTSQAVLEGPIASILTPAKPTPAPPPSLDETLKMLDEELKKLTPNERASMSAEFTKRLEAQKSSEDLSARTAETVRKLQASRYELGMSVANGPTLPASGQLFGESLGLYIYPWDAVVHLSGLAAGESISSSNGPATVSTEPSSTDEADPNSKAPIADPAPTPSPFSSPTKPTYSWSTLQTAFLARAKADDGFRTWVAKHPAMPSPAKTGASSKSTEGEDGEDEVDLGPDLVVEAVKNDPKLTKHEQKIVGTIVDPKAIRDSFQDVHLPDKTVDAIRSVVSLPLLFPEAFSTGILKNHSTTGALLFGPPGTGKTLLVRALAKESGARMMAIQPSDVMDMYFGEAEKLVKAVFKIARRLAPCIIFVDEIDALFQARSGGGGSGGDSARRQMLTEFMQEMDGLNSAASNREKGLIMIGATNRPQDLDEAVLRRLPRRLMIDLPGPKEREAILRILLRTETLASDVDLKQLAKDTPSYSGSDLKHLCVVAAQEAVKELYTVPWAKKATPSGSATAPTPSSTAAPTPETASTTPPTPPATLDPTPTPTLDPSPSPEAPPPPPTASVTSTITSSSPPSSEDKATPAPSPSDNPAPAPSQDTTLLPLEAEPEVVVEDPSVGAPTPPTDPTDEKKAKKEERKVKPRVLNASHFKVALANSSSSGSEEIGALPELRKWNEQFGDAGTKKNKKSGFGKGFGFGEKETDADKKKVKDGGGGALKETK